MENKSPEEWKQWFDENVTREPVPAFIQSREDKNIYGHAGACTWHARYDSRKQYIWQSASRLHRVKGEMA